MTMNNLVRSDRPYTYDNSEQTVTVHVEDNGDGTLAITYDGKKTYADAAFTNTYTATGTSVTLEARKALAGTDMVEGQFLFTLSGISENAANTEQTVSNAADGTVTFNEIAYNKPGEYK